MIYIIDTYAWIEYIKGSKQGLVLKKLFENNGNKFITLECCISELVGFCLKNNIDFGRIFSLIKTNSIILPVLQEHWIKAAKIRFNLRKDIKNFSLIDSILVAKQQELRCKVVSGDPHFKGLNDVIFIQ